MPEKVRVLRDSAMRAFNAGIVAADPKRALKKALKNHPLPRPQDGGKRIIISIGKAAVGLMKAVQCNEDRFETIKIIVTNYENKTTLENCDVLLSGHPVPDENGLFAAKRVMQLVKSAGPKDCVIVLVSGGASALLPAPHPDISLQDKILVNEILLSNGFDITETNLMRQSLSVLKGGGLSRLAAPSSVTSYILSDVIGDDLRVIASGPTASAIGTRQDAVAMMRDKSVFDQLPEAVRKLLQSQEREKTNIEAKNILIGSNRVSAKAMSKAVNATLFDRALIGDVKSAAKEIVSKALRENPAEPFALAWGGETTVNIQGTGLGGRNQELSLRVAALMQEHVDVGHWVFLSGATDGVDGPTDAAGGLVDAESVDRIERSVGALDSYLADNNSYHALVASGDIIKIGATGTNVADLQLFLSVPR